MAHPETNWQLWAIWNQRVEECHKKRIHITNPADFKSLCCHLGNTGTSIITLGNHSYSRCNVFNCPLGSLK